MPWPQGRPATQETIERRRQTMLANGKRRIQCLWSPTWLRAAVEEHKTARAIARHVKCSHKTVLEAFERHRINPPVVPKTRKQTMRKRRDAIELYRKGHTLRAIADRLGEVDPTTVENWAREAGILREKGRSKRLTYNSEITERGRQRIALVRRIVELSACEGLGRDRIAKELGVSRRIVQNAVESPYGQALRYFVFGNAHGQRRETHARAMHVQGCNVELIARTLDAELEEVRTWIRGGDGLVEA